MCPIEKVVVVGACDVLFSITSSPSSEHHLGKVWECGVMMVSCSRALELCSRVRKLLHLPLHTFSATSMCLSPELLLSSFNQEKRLFLFYYSEIILFYFYMGVLTSAVLHTALATKRNLYFNLHLIELTIPLPFLLPAGAKGPPWPSWRQSM